LTPGVAVFAGVADQLLSSLRPPADALPGSALTVTVTMVSPGSPELA
jgi:hypothetical protein